MVIYRPWQDVSILEGRSKGQRSDVEKSYSGGTDMEVIIVELGLYDNVTTGIQRHMSALTGVTNVTVNSTITLKKKNS